MKQNKKYCSKCDSSKHMIANMQKEIEELRAEVNILHYEKIELSKQIEDLEKIIKNYT